MQKIVPRSIWEDGGMENVILLIPMVFTLGVARPLALESTGTLGKDMNIL